jgi:hypothetical protein
VSAAHKHKNSIPTTEIKDISIQTVNPKNTATKDMNRTRQTKSALKPIRAVVKRLVINDMKQETMKRRALPVLTTTMVVIEEQLATMQRMH